MVSYKETYSAADIDAIKRHYNPLDVRTWPFYAIVMPLNDEDQGPCEIGEATKLTWEVWDMLCGSHGSYVSLSEAINEAMRMTKEVMGGSED